MTKLLAIAAAAAALATAFAVAPVAAQDIPDIVIPIESNTSGTVNATVGIGAPGITDFGMNAADPAGNGGSMSVTTTGGITLGAQYDGGGLSISNGPAGTTVTGSFTDGTYSGSVSTSPAGTSGSFGYSDGTYSGGFNASPGSVGATFGYGF